MHRPANPAREHLDEIRAMIWSVKLWFLELVAYAAAWAGVREVKLWAQAETVFARRCARQSIFLLAFARLDVPRAPGGGPYHRLRPPRGYRVRRSRHRIVRHLTRGVRLRTCADIRAALETIDAIAARAALRVRWRRRTGGFIVVAPPAERVAPRADRPAPDGADTS